MCSQNAPELIQGVVKIQIFLGKYAPDPLPLHKHTHTCTDNNYRPGRTIVLCSWAAEEPSWSSWINRVCGG